MAEGEAPTRPTKLPEFRPGDKKLISEKEVGRVIAQLESEKKRKREADIKATHEIVKKADIENPPDEFDTRLVKPVHEGGIWKRIKSALPTLRRKSGL